MNLDEIRKKINEKGSREARSSGNPNNGDIDRELSGRGRQRQADDIPMQDYSTWYRTQKSNVTLPFHSTTLETGGSYRAGAASRPAIRHDDGFSKFPMRNPELSDYLSLYK
ncbi:hypothetical protein [Teredinibacter haidensis]|uniref:hypothetical protein n=1 Tax=Teredinibacter haidensis TaxID=2731755 RepID=UPI000948DC3E|nr:hypothetical protein [Teredinibacter haidensis]